MAGRPKSTHRLGAGLGGGPMENGRTRVALKEQMLDRRAAILARWTEQTLSTYPKDTVTFLRKQKDPFANPVGHAILAGQETLLDALLGDDDLEAAIAPLQDIVRIRAVQEFTPTEALGFVFLLKDAVAASVGKGIEESPDAEAFRRFCDRVDALALAGFDFYAECRQRVYELRLTELRNQVVDVRETVLAKQGKWDKLARLQSKKQAAGEPVTLPVLHATPGIAPTPPGGGGDLAASRQPAPGADGEPQNNQPVE